MIFLDLETTGLENKDRICSVGLSVEERSYCELINPGKKIPPLASSIHHITNEMVKDAPLFAVSESSTLLKEMNSPKNILISHNAPFDTMMLEKEGIIWQGNIIDTLKCSKALMPDLDRYGLQYLRYECKLYQKEEKYFSKYALAVNPHNSLSDALHTKMLFEYLLELSSVDNLVNVSKNHVLLYRLPFGKYAKKRIEEIAIKDPSYLHWMLDSMMELEEDLRYSIDYFLRKIS